MNHFISTPNNRIYWDTETTGLRPYKGDRPYAFSFANDDGDTAYVEFPVNPITREVTYDCRLTPIKAVLEDPKIAKVGHNTKFDITMSEVGCGTKTRGRIDDTMFMAHVANPTEMTLELKPLCKKYGVMGDEDKDALHKATVSCRRYAKKKGWNIHEDVSPDYWLCSLVAKTDVAFAETIPDLGRLVEFYAVRDSLRLVLLGRMYRKVLRDEGVEDTYEFEMRKLWPVVHRMERRGVRVDLGIVKSEVAGCGKTISSLREKLVARFGDFNKEVPDGRIRAYLFGSPEHGGLGLVPDPDKYTEKTQQPQVSRDVLKTFLDRAPDLVNLIEFDRHRKAQETYFQNYLDMAILEDGTWVIHANFNQIGPVTGRFSSREPNLQNVPKRAPKGDVMLRVRGPFGPRPGYRWLLCDFKSIEARIFAEEADETDMIRIFAEGGDVYQELVNRVAEITGLDLEAMFADQGGARQVCKNNFLGWTYGEGVLKMARAMKLSEEHAGMAIMALKMAYPKAMDFMEKMQREAARNGCVRNRYNRRIPIPKPLWKDGRWYSFNYKAVNYLIQSTAADLLKRAMVRCDDLLQKLGVDAHLVMTIHDELVFEIREEEFTCELVRLICRTMADNEGIFKKVNTPVDPAVVITGWNDKKELKHEVRAGRQLASISGGLPRGNASVQT